MMDHDDQMLARSLRRSKSDPLAFSDFYRRTADGLLRDLTRRVFLPEVALDLMAETMAQAFIGRRKFKGSTDAEARGWLHAIGGHQVALYYRRQRVETKALQRLGLERPEPPDEAESLLIQREALSELQAALKSALEGLPPEQQDIIELRLLRNERYDDIAVRLGISETAARARVSRALKALRNAIRDTSTLKGTTHATSQ